MAFLTDEKLVIVGAGGMIGSNMVQSVLMLGLTPNICLYDIYEPGVHISMSPVFMVCMTKCATAHSLVQTSLTLLIPRRLSQVLSTSSLQVVLPVRRV